MASSTDLDNLRATLTSLKGHGVVPGVSAELQTARDTFARMLAAAVAGEVPAYQESANPELIPELETHLAEVVDDACRLLAGERVGDFTFVAEHARRRAAQKFPLDAILHAYRCVHRQLSRWVRDAALAAADESAQVRRVVAAVTDFTVEYTGALGSVLTSEYVAYTRVLAEAEGDRRTRLLDTLLSGYDESDRIAAQLLRRAGYLEQRQAYCVVVARSVNPREMENPARAQRMADTLSEVFGGTPLRCLVGVRDNHVVAIVSGTRRQSGWTAPQSRVADRVYPLLRQMGPAALIGLSNDMPSTSHIPRAASEAQLALDFADVANRVMPYSRIPFRQMLVSHAREAVQGALPAWLEGLTKSDQKSRGALLATLRTYADADMNVLRAAEQLSIHPNTIYARMRKIRELTGLDPLNYHGLTEMLLATDCADENSRFGVE
jgi:hypothetical protein